MGWGRVAEGLGAALVRSISVLAVGLVSGWPLFGQRAAPPGLSAWS